MEEKKKFRITEDEWYDNFALEVEFDNPDNFLQIKETLTRIGILSRKDNKLYQSCHILHKRGWYYIVHFKELFALDGRFVDITEDDIRRRNSIASLLEQWGLLKIRNKEDWNIVGDTPLSSGIKVIKYQDKDKYELVSKYQIGNRRK